jgi:hypothetical protein
MQLPQEWQTWCRLAIEQHEDYREIMLLHPPVECFVIFDDLPGPEPLFSNKQEEGGCFRDALRQFGKPKAAGAQTRRCKENLGLGILAAQRIFDALHERKVLRVVAEKPAPHAETANSATSLA